jgi:AcrR family transcriptional regulator
MREQLVTPKAEETRERIVDAALRLFREKGFDETTMRDIAAEAGVATGAAYYYFRAKEDLVMALYVRASEETRDVVPRTIELSKDLKRRIRTIIDANLDIFGPHRRLLGALVRIGMNPKHPLSPFAAETAQMREEGIALFRLAVNGSSSKIPRDVVDELPRMLWLYQLGIILFWIYDESPGQYRTRALIDGTVDLVVRLIQLSSLPLLGSVRRRAVKLLHDVTD